MIQSKENNNSNNSNDNSINKDLCEFINKHITQSVQGITYWRAHKHHKCYKCHKYGHLAADCSSVCPMCHNLHSSMLCYHSLIKMMKKITWILMNHTIKSPEILKEKIQKEYTQLVGNEAEGTSYKFISIQNNGQLQIGQSKYSNLKILVTDQWSISKSESFQTFEEYKNLLIKNKQIKNIPPNGQVLTRCHIQEIKYKKKPLGRLFITQKEVEYKEYEENKQNKQVIAGKCKKAIARLRNKIKNNNKYLNFVKDETNLRSKVEQETQRLKNTKKQIEKEKKKMEIMQLRKDKLHEDIKDIIKKKTRKIEINYQRLNFAKQKFYDKVDKFRGNKNAFYNKKNEFYNKQKETKQKIRDKIRKNEQKHYDILKDEVKKKYTIARKDPKYIEYIERDNKEAERLKYIADRKAKIDRLCKGKDAEYRKRLESIL